MSEAISLDDVLRAWKDIEPGFVYRDKAADKNVDQSLKAINLTVGYLKQRKKSNETD